MQDKQQIEQYLYQAIPLAQAMAVRVVAAEEGRVELEAPLEPNINHCATVFGGSAAAVATLAGWLLVYRTLQALGLRGQVMVRRSQMDYQKAMHGAFTARTLPVNDAAMAAHGGSLVKRAHGTADAGGERGVCRAAGWSAGGGVCGVAA